MEFPYLKVILRGVSQVMLQNNSLTGLLFLLGIMYNSRVMAAGAVIGVLASTITAYSLKYERNDVENGLYGFNGALVGIALAFFFKLDTALIFFIAVGAAASSVLMWLLKKRIPPYTLPFVLVTGGIYLLATTTGVISKNPAAATSAGLSVASAAAIGIGQVMFQASAITGMIFLFGILANSARSALFALIGSVIGIAVATAAGFEASFIGAGLFSFNAVLCAIALGKDTKRGFLLALFSSVASVFITFGMMRFNLPVLTFPFVAATWVVLLLAAANFKKKVMS